MSLLKQEICFASLCCGHPKSRKAPAWPCLHALPGIAHSSKNFFCAAKKASALLNRLAPAFVAKGLFIRCKGIRSPEHDFLLLQSGFVKQPASRMNNNLAVLDSLVPGFNSLTPVCPQEAMVALAPPYFSQACFTRCLPASSPTWSKSKWTPLSARIATSPAKRKPSCWNFSFKYAHHWPCRNGLPGAVQNLCADHHARKEAENRTKAACTQWPRSSIHTPLFAADCTRSPS